MDPILVHTANRTLTEVNFGCFAAQVAQYSIDNSFSQTFGYIQFIEPNVVEFYYEANLTSGENGQLDALLAAHDKTACDQAIQEIPSEESSDVGYDASTSGLSSNTVQGAIDELAVNTHIQNTDQFLDFGGGNQISAAEANAKLDDAPSDSKEYARKDGGWVEVTTGSSGIPEAPNDGNTYSRQNESWVNIQADLDKSHDQNTDTFLDFGGANQISAAEAVAKLDNVVEDTSPELGGNLETAGNNITSTSNDLSIATTGGNLTLGTTSGNLLIQASSGSVALTSTSFVSINGLKYPTTDGSVNQFIRTDGAGNLSLDTIAALVVSYDNSVSGLTATNVKAALDEIDGRVDTNDAKVSADGSIDTHSDVDVTTTAPVVGDRFVFDGLNWVPEKPQDRYIELYQNAITTSTNSSTDINVQWDVSKNTGSLFTFSPTSAVIEVNQDGYYFISYDISLNMTSGSSRTNGRGRIYVDTGSGYSIVPGGTSYSYNRNSSQGLDTLSKSTILQMSSGDKTGS